MGKAGTARLGHEVEVVELVLRDEEARSASVCKEGERENARCTRQCAA